MRGLHTAAVRTEPDERLAYGRGKRTETDERRFARLRQGYKQAEKVPLAAVKSGKRCAGRQLGSQEMKPGKEVPGGCQKAGKRTAAAAERKED